MRLYVVPSRKGGALTQKYYAAPVSSLTRKKGCGKLEEEKGGCCGGEIGGSVKSVDVAGGQLDKLDNLRRVLADTSLNIGGKPGLKMGKKKIRL